MPKKKKGSKKNSKRKNNDFFILLSVCALLMLFFTFFNFNPYPKTVFQRTENNQEDNVLSNSDSPNEAFWNDLLESHPNYVAGWIELAEIEYKKNNFQSAFNNYINAKNVSPNHQAVIEFEDDYSNLLEDYL